MAATEAIMIIKAIAVIFAAFILMCIFLSPLSFIAKLEKSLAKASLYSDFLIRLVKNLYSITAKQILLNSTKKTQELENGYRTLPQPILQIAFKRKFPQTHQHLATFRKNATPKPAQQR
jgi:hypothetical protein